MFKVNNKNTRTTSLTPLFSVSIVDIERVLVSWVLAKVRENNKTRKIGLILKSNFEVKTKTS